MQGEMQAASLTERIPLLSKQTGKHHNGSIPNGPPPSSSDQPGATNSHGAIADSASFDFYCEFQERQSNSQQEQISGCGGSQIFERAYNRYPLLLSFLYFTFAAYTMCRTQVQAQLWSDSVHDASQISSTQGAHAYKILPDLGFMYLPHLSGPAVLNPQSLMSWADLWTLATLLVTATRFSVFGTGKRRILLRRYLCLYATLILLRSACIITTLLPNPYKRCAITMLPNPWLEAFMVMCLIHKTCADVLFSGHTVDVTMCALVWWYYSRTVPLTLPWRSVACCGSCEPATRSAPRRVPTWATSPAVIYAHRAVAVLVVLLGYFFIIATRLHYTADVFVGATLTLLLWYWYHAQLSLLRLTKKLSEPTVATISPPPTIGDVRQPTSPMDRLISWLEQDEFSQPPLSSAV